MKIFIGIPTYDGEEFIVETITSLLDQTYKNFTIYISDNGPTDKIGRLIEGTFRDHRILYNKNSKNLGPGLNFIRCLEEFEKSNCDAFMWAQSDDTWDEEYLENCIQGLETAEVVVTELDTIDSFGNVIRLYKTYKRFLVSRVKSVTTFLIERDISGKSNLFMALYCRSAALNLLKVINFKRNHFDFVISFNILANHHLTLIDKKMYHKRYDRENDKKTYTPPVNVNTSRFDTLAPNRLFDVHFGYIRCAKEIKIKILIFIIMLIKIPSSIFTSILNFLRSKKNSILRTRQSEKF